jgi:DNA repair ATPase RecN
MANVVTTKLTKLSNQYSASVKELRELEAKLRSGGAGVSDAEAKRLNGLIKTVDAKRLKLMEDYNKLKKLEKPAKDYISISGDIKDIQAQINKATARGENTASLQTKLNTLTSKFNSIAPKVEAAFPEIKVKLPYQIPLNNVYKKVKKKCINIIKESIISNKNLCKII